MGFARRARRVGLGTARESAKLQGAPPASLLSPSNQTPWQIYLAAATLLCGGRGAYLPVFLCLSTARARRCTDFFSLSAGFLRLLTTRADGGSTPANDDDQGPQMRVIKKHGTRKKRGEAKREKKKKGGADVLRKKGGGLCTLETRAGAKRTLSLGRLPATFSLFFWYKQKGTAARCCCESLCLLTAVLL